MGNHNTLRNIVTGQLDKADPHLTLFMGQAVDKIQVEGHLFVKERGKTKIPERKMLPSEREILRHDNDFVTAEYTWYRGWEAATKSAEAFRKAADSKNAPHVKSLDWRKRK